MSQRDDSLSGKHSRWTSPLKAFEYMSAGLPVVASDLENLREVFIDGETALLCPPDAPDAWEAALRRLAGDAALRHRLGAQAAELFAEQYTWSERARVISRDLELCR